MTDQNGAAASLAAALADLQTQLPHVTKDATNPHFKSRYATLDAITAALLPIMGKLGLSFTCAPGWYAQADGSPARFVLRYKLMHAPTGEHETGLYPLPESGNPQQIGSAITYARRYALCAVTGLAPDDDDDGNEASPPPPARTARSLTPAQQKAARAPDPHRGQTPTEQRAVRARRVAEERATAQARAETLVRPEHHQDASRVDTSVWEGPDPEDRPGSATPGQHKALEALLGQHYGLDSKDRDGRHQAVQQLLSLPAAPASMNDLSYNQALAARNKIVAVMAEREREAKMAASAAPDHAQLAAGDYPEDWPG